MIKIIFEIVGCITISYFVGKYSIRVVNTARALISLKKLDSVDMIFLKWKVQKAYDNGYVDLAKDLYKIYVKNEKRLIRERDHYVPSEFRFQKAYTMIAPGEYTQGLCNGWDKKITDSILEELSK